MSMALRALAMQPFIFFGSLPELAVHLVSAACFTSESLNESMNTTSGAVRISCAERAGLLLSLDGFESDFLASAFSSSGLSLVSELSSGLASAFGSASVSAGFGVFASGVPPHAAIKSNGKNSAHFDIAATI